LGWVVPEPGVVLVLAVLAALLEEQRVAVVLLEEQQVVVDLLEDLPDVVGLPVEVLQVWQDHLAVVLHLLVGRPVDLLVVAGQVEDLQVFADLAAAVGRLVEALLVLVDPPVVAVEGLVALLGQPVGGQVVFVDQAVEVLLVEELQA